MQNFRKATWHGVTGPEPKSGDYGLSFRMGDGSVIRLTLSAAQAHAVRDTLNIRTGLMRLMDDAPAAPTLTSPTDKEPDA